ncbi:hypothetical protein Tco_0010338 [Tanacetum coccineum]
MRLRICVTCGGAHSWYNCPATDNNQAIYKRNNDQMLRNMQSQINSLKGDLKNEIQNTIKSQQAILMNQQTTFQNNLQNMIMIVSKPAFNSGTLPSQHHSKIRRVVERETEETTDKEQTNFQGSTAQILPPVIPISIPEPDVPTTSPKTIPIPESDIPKNALLLMPRFAPTIKSLLMNKEKLLELAKIPLNENCSAMLLKKLPEKLGDPGNFSPELTPHSETLELADRSITYPKGLAEDVFVKVGKFHFPTDLLLSISKHILELPHTWKIQSKDRS